jgi:hypothetical protein
MKTIETRKKLYNSSCYSVPFHNSFNPPANLYDMNCSENSFTFLKAIKNFMAQKERSFTGEIIHHIVIANNVIRIFTIIKETNQRYLYTIEGKN